MVRIILVSLLSILASISFGQKQFKLDEQRILNNENLDYFISCLKSEKFEVLRGKDAIPLFIKRQLPWISDKQIADKSKPFQATDVIIDTALPLRQLMFACKNDHLLVMTYKKGGIGVRYKTLFVRFSKNIVTDVWVGSTFCEHLNSTGMILECIAKNRNRKWGLNTNILDE